MAGPHPDVAALRLAVRGSLNELDARLGTGRPAGTDAPILVAVSGGADSLALAATAAFEATSGPRRRGSVVRQVGAVIVDHGLQPSSAKVAETAAQVCRRLGLDPVQVNRVTVTPADDGVEAAARTARYEALAAQARDWGAPAVLTGHTRDDQAEQVLLGLARGSGSRSLAGMPAVRPLASTCATTELIRPLLGCTRAQTLAVCAELGLDPWHDPHNDDRRYLRVRARSALAELETALGPGVAAALARSADLLRADADALQQWSARVDSELGPMPWVVAQLADLPPAIRRRLWHRAGVAAGCPPGTLTAEHLFAVDALVGNWSGQGPINLPAGVRAHRSQGRVWLSSRRGS